MSDGLFSFKCILNLYWNNYFNSGHYFISGCDVKLSLKFILNHYWNNYFNSGRYFKSGCNNGHLFTHSCTLRGYYLFNEWKFHLIFLWGKIGSLVYTFMYWNGIFCFSGCLQASGGVLWREPPHLFPDFLLLPVC